MTAIKILTAAVIIAVIALIGFELVSPTLTARDVNTAASDVASAGAAKLFAERGCGKSFDVLTTDAHAAAAAAAANDHVTLTTFTIDASQVVHVSVEKEARSLVFKHINGLRKRDEIKKSTTAAPTGLAGKPCP
jgi:hypothetical protein